jgi:predicted outer membrane repeat protein
MSTRNGSFVFRMFSVFMFLSLLFSAVGVTPARAVGNILYVDADSACAAFCGDSWAMAYPNLQTALTASVSGDQIWVAEGVYYPGTTDRASTFTLKNGVAIYGGFNGTEDKLFQRDPATHITVLSGDIDKNDSQTPIITDLTIVTGNTTNSYNVVTGTSGATLDGFTITAGFADGGAYPNDRGGGMFNESSSPVLTNLTFSGNSAISGGGMGNRYSSPTLTNVTFSGNSATQYGGGMGNEFYSNPMLTNVTFGGNSAVERGGGMINSTFSNPTLTNVTFSANSASNGGGMYNNSNPTLTNVTFNVNSAADSGGGMFNGYSSPTLTDVTFNSNSAIYGGGMYNSSSSPVLTDVTFNGNTASGGGGMENYASSSPSLTDVIFTNNTASSGGGMHNDESNPTLTNVTFSSNTATHEGGGMYNWESDPSLINVTINNNTAVLRGGGMGNYSSSPLLTNVIFSANTADDGGGMHNSYSTNPTLTNVTFSGNSATSTGGGMYNSSNSNPTLTNVTFSGNSTTSLGGGMYNGSSSPVLTNVTFSSNTATGNGGGMFNYTSSPVLTNVTFSANSTTSLGGGIYNHASSNPQIRNTIFWGNTATTTGAQIYNSSTSIPSVSDSVVQDGCPAGSACTNIITGDPLLGALGNYGGLTQTIPLQAGSSAIDTGYDVVCTDTDQRGLERPQGVYCDIGAYEYDLPPYVKSIARSNTNPTNLASVDFTVTFNEAVTGVNTGDFALAVTGVTGASITGMSGGPKIYTVSVSTGAGDGTIRLDVNASGTGIQDLTGKPISGGFTGGEEYSINKSSLILFTPLDGDTLLYNRPTFDWADFTGAIGYNIQIAKNATFTKLVSSTNLAGVTNSTYTPAANLTANTNMWWRVRAKLTATTYTAWSDVRSFHTANPPGVPVLVAPTSNALVTSTTPLFNWNNSTLPAGTTFDKYQIQVSTSNTFGTTVIDDFTTLADIADSDYTPGTGILTTGATYYWRVRSWNTDGAYSAWSAVRSMRIKYNPPVNLNVTSSLKPTFTWDAVIGATSYTIQVSRNNTFTLLMVNKMVILATYVHTLNLTTGSTYYWRVRVNGPYGPSDWSAIQTFVTP